MKETRHSNVLYIVEDNISVEEGFVGNNICSTANIVHLVFK